MKEYIFAGVGGQGVVLASRILANYYIKEDYKIRTTETIGMAQMGGSVVSHLRASQNQIHSPFVGDNSADIIYSFEPGEVMKNLNYANQDTSLILHNQDIESVTEIVSKNKYDKDQALAYLKENYKNLYICDFRSLFRKMGTNKPLNICMLAYSAGAGLLDMDTDLLIDSIKDMVKDKYIDLNIYAFENAYKMGEDNE